MVENHEMRINNYKTESNDMQRKIIDLIKDVNDK